MNNFAINQRVKTSIAIAIFIMSAPACALAATNRPTEGDTLLGVLTLGANYSIEDTIKVYNDDGSLWYWFAFNDDIKNPPYVGFSPFGFHPDYSMLAIRVVSMKGDQYEIIANEETGLKKIVKVKKPGALKLQTFQTYLKDSLFEFDFNTNPIRQTINGTPVVTHPSSDFSVSNLGMKGDWMKIKYVDHASRKEAVGWIRWRKGKEILIHLLVG